MSDLQNRLMARHSGGSVQDLSSFGIVSAPEGRSGGVEPAQRPKRAVKLG